MKIAAALVLSFAVSAQAFVPVHQPSPVTSALGANAKPAKSAEEDLDLTRKVIASFLGDDGSSDDSSAPAPAPAKEDSKDE